MTFPRAKTVVREGRSTYLVDDGEVKQCLSVNAKNYTSFDGRVPRSSKRAKLMVEAAGRSSRLVDTKPLEFQRCLKRNTEVLLSVTLC